MKKVVRVIPNGEVRDSRNDSRLYWAGRSPAERIAAVKELRESTYRRIHGRPMPPMAKTARPFKFT